MFLVFVPCTPTSRLNTAFNLCYCDNSCHLMLHSYYSLNLQICYLQSSVFFVALAYECFCVERVSVCVSVSELGSERGRERERKSDKWKDKRYQKD